MFQRVTHQAIHLNKNYRVAITHLFIIYNIKRGDCIYYLQTVKRGSKQVIYKSIRGDVCRICMH
jgi:hypothetical protein